MLGVPFTLVLCKSFANVLVENLEVARRQNRLEQRLSRLQQWARRASKREAQASLRQEPLHNEYKSRSDTRYREPGL
jgi:hypothetical protein